MDSHRRLRMLEVISARIPSPRRANPSDGLFHPWHAAVAKAALGHRDEAFWLLFLGVHFGRHRRGRWRYVSALYGRLGQGGLWDWQTVSSDLNTFRDWLDANIEAFRRIDSGFGNHRKYESLDARSRGGTGEVVATYVDWVSTAGSHDALFDRARHPGHDTPEIVFERVYRSMDAVARFGKDGAVRLSLHCRAARAARHSPGFRLLDECYGTPHGGAAVLYLDGTAYGP